MIPIRDNVRGSDPSRVTTTLVVLNVIVYLWDRGGRVFGEGVIFSDLYLRPAEFLSALSGKGDATSLVTIFTSMFLHGSIWHLITNVTFLLAFGDNVERVLGPVRYTLYYLFWGFVAMAAHIYVMPSSMVPTLGASGAIGGVLGAYFLIFPSNVIRFWLLPLVFFDFKVRAWVLLAAWFLLQIFWQQEGVANWAHVGGFAAGMLTVLIMGGREKVLQGIKLEREEVEVDL
jgi:membrane associated rhomboid family serine protease